MQTTPTFDALVQLIQAREAHLDAAVKAHKQGRKATLSNELGFAAGIAFALDVLENAGENVASARYIAQGGK